MSMGSENFFETYFDRRNITGKVQSAIAQETAQTLRQFCEQEPEFAQAIEQSGKSFQDCLDAVAKNVGQSISDFEVYSRAVTFYFPGAKVRFQMAIDLTGEAGDAHESGKPAGTASGSGKITVSFNAARYLDF